MHSSASRGRIRHGATARPASVSPSWTRSPARTRGARTRPTATAAAPSSRSPSPRQRLFQLVLVPGREGQAPVLVGPAVDRQPPLVAPARLDRERPRVDGEWKIEWGPRLQAGRPADLENEIVEEEDRLLLALVGLDRHG